MKRRRVNRGLAVGVIGLFTPLAGCGFDSGALEVTNVEAEVTSEQNVQLTIDVQNTFSESRTGTLTAEVDVNDGERYTNARQVNLPAESSDTFVITINRVSVNSLDEVTYDAYFEG